MKSGRRSSVASRIMVGLLGCWALSACGMDGTREASYRPNPVYLPRVETVPRALVVRGTEPLDEGEFERIRAFAVAFRERGRGPLRLTVTDRDRSRAQRTVDQLLVVIQRQGVPPAAVEVNTSAGQAGGLELGFSDFVAIPPDCPFELRGKDLSDNGPSSLIGCALERSIAAVIANPADLISPQNREIAHTGRMIEVINRYRLGKPTEAVRTTKTVGAGKEIDR